ncbi:MAG: putative oxidoreductase [Frankiales bacterium]|nr:putative oxidoreductase [Frankiales bacterium]
MADSGTPGWDTDPIVARTPRRPSLSGVRTADVCVVGLGASGLSAMAEVLRRGLSVIGLDAGRIAAGAAGRNGGFLLAGPAPGVQRAAESWGVAAAMELYRDTVNELDWLAQTLGPDIVRRAGSLRLAGLPGDPRSEFEAADRLREIADCQEQLSFLTGHGIRAEWYSGTLGEGLFLPDDGAMNPARRALSQAGRLGDAGARCALFEHSAARSISAGSVKTTAGEVRCGLVVVAVDGGLDVLLPELAGRVRTARLQMLATEPLPDLAKLPCPVYGRWGYDYAQQDPAGRLFLGGGRDIDVEAEWTTDSQPTEVVQAYLDGLVLRFAGNPVPVSHRWAASVGYTEDGRALVTSARDGVVACGGYNGTGNLVGPVAARAAVTLGLDGTPPPACFAS